MGHGHHHHGHHHHGHHHHGHHYHGESLRDYFTEQLLTILVCGLFGFAAVQMYRLNMLEFLAPQFRAPVLYGGAALLLLVVVRAVAVWKEAGELQHEHADCAHDHAHTGDHHHHATDPHHHHAANEDPDLSGHEHSHSHDMSWTFARMLILVFPVALFFLGLPNATFSKDRQLAMAGTDTALGAQILKELAAEATVIEEKPAGDGVTVRLLRTRTGLKIRETITSGEEPKLELVREEGTTMRFNDLNDAAYDDAKRKSLSGQTAILEGRFKRLADKEFTLFRMKMTCCAADTVMLKVRIIVPQALSGFTDFDWVRVKGQIQFLPDVTGKGYIPVLMVADITDVQKGEAKNEYEI